MPGRVEVGDVGVNESGLPDATTEASAPKVLAATSPKVSAGTNVAPRSAASVSPPCWIADFATSITTVPAAAARSNAVGVGCHTAGSTDLSHCSELISRPVPGIATL